MCDLRAEVEQKAFLLKIAAIFSVPGVGWGGEIFPTLPPKTACRPFTQIREMKFQFFRVK